MRDSFEAEPKSAHVAELLRRMALTTRHNSVRIVSATTHEMYPSSWEGGSKTYTALSGCVTGPPDESGRRTVTLPGPGAVVATYGVHRGKTQQITFYVHPERFEFMKAALPQPGELTEAQIRVLSVASAYNPRGRKEWRERGDVSKESWGAVVSELAALGLMKKAGSVTPAGHNIAESGPYRREVYQLHGLGE